MKTEKTEKECCVPPPHLKDARALKCWEVKLHSEVRPANPIFSKGMNVNGWRFKLDKNPQYIIDGKTSYTLEGGSGSWTEGKALIEDKTGLGMFDMSRPDRDGRRLYYSLQKCKSSVRGDTGFNKIMFVQIDNSMNEKKGKVHLIKIQTISSKRKIPKEY